MAGSNFQRLFLLELMVHKICYTDVSSLSTDFLATLGPTYIEFVSDSFPFINMSEDEFGATGPFDSFNVTFKSGKSCMFALRNYDGPVSDKAQISVSRFMPPGGGSPHYKFGTAYLKMSPGFLSVLYDNSSGASNSKCLQVCLDILNGEAKSVATISIFLRLTSFGISIITQFQVDAIDNKTFNFRGNFLPQAKGRNSGSQTNENGSHFVCSTPLPCPPSGTGNNQVMNYYDTNYGLTGTNWVALMGKIKDDLITDLINIMSSTVANKNYAVQTGVHNFGSVWNQQMIDQQNTQMSNVSPQINYMPYRRLEYKPSLVNFNPGTITQYQEENGNKELINLPSEYGVKNIYLNTAIRGYMNHRPISSNRNLFEKLQLEEGKKRFCFGNVSENVLCKPSSSRSRQTSSQKFTKFSNNLPLRSDGLTLNRYSRL